MSSIYRVFYIVLLSGVLGFFAWSCGYSSPVARLLDQSERSLEAAPDSAFVSIDSMDRSLLNSPELRARHALLYSQALEKCGIEVYDDSIIHIAIDYYASVGDSEHVQQARACLERSR